MKTTLLNIKGEKTGTVKLPKEIFGVAASPQLVAQAVRVYLTNQRKARAKVKDRSEVRGSRVKIWRQKGTGRARHGDRYAPIFVGGGVAHGPRGVLKRLTLSKKMKRKALYSVLSDKVRDKQIVVVDGFDKIKPKTKEMVGVLEKLLPKKSQSLPKSAKSGKKEKKVVGVKKLKSKTKTLLALNINQKNVTRASRNIANVEVVYVNQLNSYQVLNNQYVIFSKSALNDFSQLKK